MDFLRIMLENDDFNLNANKVWSAYHFKYFQNNQIWKLQNYTNPRLPTLKPHPSEIVSLKLGNKMSLTLVLLRGVVPTPLTVFALVLKIVQPRGKIAPGTFKFILSLHFSEKIPNLPPTPGVGKLSKLGGQGGWCDPVIFELDFLKIFEVIMHSQVCLQVRIAIF